MSKKTKAILVAIFALIVVGAVAVAVIFGSKKANEGKKSFTIEVTSDRDNYTKTTECKSDMGFLGEYLRTFEGCQFEESDYGIFITGFDGYEQDTDNQYWWCLYVNGETSMVGADEVPLTDGDTYSFVLTQGW